MARGLNKVLLIGNLGKDPEMKYTPQGAPITNFTVAVSRTWRTPEGENKEETEWFRIVAWEKLAEICNEYLRKGSKVFIEGRLQTRSWEKDGQKQYMTEVVANEMMMLDSRNGPGGPGTGNTGNLAGSNERPARSSAAAGPSNGFDDDGDTEADDIPF